MQRNRTQLSIVSVPSLDYKKMPTTQQWRGAAQASLEAAKILQDSFPASAVNRAYYSAYQIAHAAMISFKFNPPQGRVNWRHDTIRDLLRAHLINTPTFQRHRPRMRKGSFVFISILRRNRLITNWIHVLSLPRSLLFWNAHQQRMPLWNLVPYAN